MKRIGILISLYFLYNGVYGQALEQLHPDPTDFPPNPHAINIVVLGDGYDEEDLGINPVGENIFASEAAQFLDEFLNTSPMREYQNYFNVWRIDEASANSGISPDPDNLIGTAYDCAFWAETPCADFGITGPSTLERLTHWNQGKIDLALDNGGFTDLATTHAVILVNTNIWTGHGNSEDQSRMISASCAATMGDPHDYVDHNDKAMHEFGHGFAKLTDEYYQDGNECWVPISGTPAYNIWDPVVLSVEPWHHWFDGINWLEGISVHEHMNAYTDVGQAEFTYHTLNDGPGGSLETHWDYIPDTEQGVFKPTADYQCKMEDSYNGHEVGFCAVCRERIVQRIHELAAPLTSFTTPVPNEVVDWADNTQEVEMAANQSQDFTIVPRFPVVNGVVQEDNLDIVWTLEGIALDPQPSIVNGEVTVTLGCADFATYDTNNDNELMLEVTVTDNTNFGYAVSNASDPQDGDWIRLPEDPTGATGHDYNRFTVTWTISNDEPDLWMKDIGWDDGETLEPIDWGMDMSPDIWVRNQPDGIETSQNPVYSGNPVYVYTTVRNRGCVDAPANSRAIDLHWTHAATSIAWPEYFTGEMLGQVLLGDYIQEGVLIPDEILAGESATFYTQWNISDIEETDIGLNFETCILANIVETPHDPFVEFEFLQDNVWNNNNMVLRNTTVVFPPDGNVLFDQQKLPPGGSILVGNVTDKPGDFDLTFRIDPDHTGKPLTDEAEVVVAFDSKDHDVATKITNDQLEGMKRTGPYTFMITDDFAAIRDVTFPANTRVNMYTGFSFLTKEVQHAEYWYHVTQWLSGGDPTGGQHYNIVRDPRYLFDADADDKEVDKNTQVTVSAEDIWEEAVYNWYDMDGNLIYTGKDLTVTADITKKYKLEVIAELDGYKDYSEVEVKVKMGEITGISPNPASYQASVSYHTQGGSSAYLAVYNTITGSSDQYILSLGQGNMNIDLSTYPTGNYEVLLVTDGEVRDTESLMVE